MSMEEHNFWQLKLLSFFHDPPGKAYAFKSGRGGHGKLARDLVTKALGAGKSFYLKLPDFIASGADRPVVSPPTRTKGVSPTPAIPYGVPGNDLATHPLDPGQVVHLRADFLDKMEPAELEALEENQRTVIEALGTIEAGDWTDTAKLRREYWTLWRRWPSGLANGRDGRAEPFWALVPAETRCPDHSIWDHLKVTSALCFLDQRKIEKLAPDRQPWLFTLSLTPIQPFIEQARKSRDLWIGSFLLADLTWHAMQPIVTQYGPDAIVYPDLRGNPLVDHWLEGRPELQGVAPGSVALEDEARTYAATLPGTFTAILPMGSSGSHLLPLRALAATCQQAVATRWSELQACVKTWLQKKVGSGWEPTWDRQHETPPIRAVWSAVEWAPPDPALRGMKLDAAKAGSSAITAAEEDRQWRLAQWVTPEQWAADAERYETFKLTNPGYLFIERGFDYGLLHHQLKARHTLRKQARSFDVAEEPGQKCTLCRERSALAPEGAVAPGVVELDGQRSVARKFWSNEALDPEKQGTERLCGVCAMKRYLVEAVGFEDQGVPAFNSIWAGRAGLEAMRGEKRVRVPFPSTAAIAAQEFLAKIATHPELTAELDAVVKAYRDADEVATEFPETLRRLADARAQATPVGKRFLELDAQTSVFPHTLDARIARSTDKQEALKALRKAVVALRRKADRLDIEPPETRFAVVAMDGDGLGRLLTGRPGRIGAKWQDVLHPKHVERLRTNATTDAAGWTKLLESERMMTPSLHAFISRCLGELSHRVVPWVVEQEFGGCLVYAGGDDLLALAPASAALLMAERLNGLLSAPWILDRRPDLAPWGWRGSRGERTELPEGLTRFEPYHEGQPVPAGCRLIPMLGRRNHLSAGVVYAHFKTHLGRVLQHARRLRDEDAKEGLDRKGGAGIAYYARNGVKGTTALRWRSDVGVSAARVIGDVRDAFDQNKLPSRLPYKLRDCAYLLELEPGAESADRERRQRLMRGLIARAVEGDLDETLMARLVQLWEAGVERVGRKTGEPDEPDDPTRAPPPDPYERTVDGLLLCRALARPDENVEEQP